MNTCCDILYLSGTKDKNSAVVSLSLESFITVFVHEYCDSTVEVCFLDKEDENNYFKITSQDELRFDYRTSDRSTALQNAVVCCQKCILEMPGNKDSSFCLPAVVTDQGKTVIAGLCAVLRWLVKAHLVKFPDHHCQNLLGFRGGCLVACTESSIWTKFCELQLPNSVKDVSLRLMNGESLTKIPESLVLLEAHLKRPVRTHNILKRKLDIAKKVKQDSSSLDDSADASDSKINFTLYDKDCTPVQKEDLPLKLQNISITEKSDEFSLNHCYLEGIDFTLADMIAFPCVHYLLKQLTVQSAVYLENVIKWYKNMCSNLLISRTAKRMGMNLIKIDENSSFTKNSADIMVPDINQISLYKRDPSHTKLKCKHQSPDKIISTLLAANICPKYDTSYCSKLDWNSLPSALHPAHGDLPQKRLERKCQQLESMVTAVLKIAKDNQVIVEFCAGGGHVGLLLAYFLPNNKIILIENKESSMMRAKQRASNLDLENVYFYQCNLDYFKGSFDIGVSLHACGVATDLVIQQCIKKQASFVCCPCCYGSIQDTHLVTYPLSKKFRNTDLTKKDYTLLAHFADRNEVNTPTAEQGEVCMGLIDTDRTFFAEEQNYETYLSTLQPVTCSPKHNLLIGISPNQVKR